MPHAGHGSSKHAKHLFVPAGSTGLEAVGLKEMAVVSMVRETSRCEFYFF